MRCLVLTLLAAVVLLSAASALADITPPVTVRLASPFVAVAPGASYEGEVQITCDAAGTLADFELSSDGWQAALKDAPTTRAVSAGDRILVAFAATAVNPGQKLVLTFTFDGHPVRYGMDLSEANFKLMTEGGALVRIPDEGRHVITPPSPEEWGLMEGLPPAKEKSEMRRAITVHGRFVYNRHDGTLMPAHSIRVEIWDSDSTSGDDLMGTGYTDYNGYYSIVVDSEDGDPLGDPDIYAKFWMQNGRVRVFEETSGNTYGFHSSTYNNFSGTDLNLGSLMPADPALHPSVHIHTHVSRIWVFDSTLGYDVPAVEVEWPSTEWTSMSPSGMMHLRDQHRWQSGVMGHEYGHWFDHEFSGWEPWDYCNYICDNDPPSGDCGHCTWCEESTVIAWLEGWANYHGYAFTAWYPSYYGFAVEYPLDYESLGSCAAGDDPYLTEGFCAALLQDISDSNQDSHGVFGTYTDRLALGNDEIFTVCDLDNPDGPADFLDKYLSRYGAPDRYLWETAANCGYQIDSQAPGVVTNLTSTSHAIGVPSIDPTATFTWTKAPDDISDIAGYGLFISSGSPGMPSATQDIGNVTSYTTPVLSPGTYYFNIRAVDNADHWSPSYASWGPFIIREPEPADLTWRQVSTWDYPLVPRDSYATGGEVRVSDTLPGDATSTYWSLLGINQGEVTTGSGFYCYLNVDGVFKQGPYWAPIGPGGGYVAPDWGPVYVTGGRHAFTCRHDATDLVSELDENNNVWGRQFVWLPAVLAAGNTTVRSAPPSRTGGWDELTSGTYVSNMDGLRIDYAGGWWHAAAIWPVTPGEDYDVALYDASAGAEDGYTTSRAYSGRVGDWMDAVFVNRNMVYETAWDIGVTNWGGTHSYNTYHAASIYMSFGDSVDVVLPAGVPMFLREFYLDDTEFGPVSVTAEIAPDEDPVYLMLLNRDYTYGTLYSGYLGRVMTNTSGFARIDVDLNTSGYYGIVVYREMPDAAKAAQTVTLEISTTPPDLATWDDAPGWHAAMTPRPALDGTPTWCPMPDTLLASPEATFLNVAVQNLGPVSSPIPNQVWFDGNYLGWVNWGEVPPGWQGTFNWDHAFLFPSGRHVLALKVDGNQEIEETDETNNLRGEQWIWSPYPLAAGNFATRSQPPPPYGGWADVSVPEPYYPNCDGLRVPTPSSGYWMGLAVRPPAGGDYDVRLHEPGVGAKEGFGEALAGSYYAGSTVDYVLADFNTMYRRAYDVGVLLYSGTGSYVAHAAESDYMGSHPTGTWGPYQIPAGGVVAMFEFYMAPEQYTITLENLSSADLGLAIHVEGDAYQSRSESLDQAWLAAGGQDEEITVSLEQYAYYCCVVWREDGGTGSAPFDLRITTSLSAVTESDVPQATRLTGVWPNPFNPQTTVAFDLAREGRARLLVYDLQGRLVSRLVDASLPAGHHSVVWQGRDESGRSVSSGIYFACLEVDGVKQLSKLTLVK